MKEFIRVLEEALPCPANTGAAKRWEYLRDTIYNAALVTFGKKQAKTADWFEVHQDEIHPFIDEKGKGVPLPPTKAHPVREYSKCLVRPGSKVQQISRHCANDFWFQLCNHIQVCADTSNLKGMYDGKNRP